MNCDEIKELLSEYVDGVLDEKTKALVEAHLSTCRDCKEELASLQKLVNELGSLESVAPPRDFLDQLHKRMEQRSPFSKTLRALFVPMRLKIPLEFAGAAAMAILVFTLLHVQQDHYRMADAPVGLKQEGVAEKGALESWGEDLKDKALKPQLSYKTTTAEPPLGKIGPIELVLVMKRAQPLEIHGPVAAMKAAPAPKEKMRRSLAKKEAVPGAQLEADKRDDDLLPQLTGAVELVGGRVVSIEYEKDSHRPESIHAEIPAEHLNTFYTRLGELGELKGAPRGVAGKEQGLLPVRIRLLSSSQ
jgi:hypothetical protein